MSKRIGKQQTSGWVDETLRPEALRIIEDISGAKNLSGEIGSLVGEYRLRASYRDTEPDRDAQLKHSEKVLGNIDTLLKNIEAMPETIKALSTEKFVRITGEHYEPVVERITFDLMRYRAVCRDAKKTMEQWPPSPGEKPKRLEDKLLSDVANFLKPFLKTKLAVAKKAGEILIAAGIPHFYGEPKSLADRIRSFRKSP